MDVTSLGYRTDLALLRLGGSTIEDRGDHLVIRTPDNPAYWWGNFLLLERPPRPEAAAAWIDRFHEAIPDARHVALGFEGTAGSVADLVAFADQGLKPEAATVMTARSVVPPPRPNTQAAYRTLASDDDWEQQIELRVACNDRETDDVYREFAAGKARTARQLVKDGHGQWFGAFLDGQLVSSMGLFTTEPSVARFQSVETHPDTRGRGLAGTLVHHVSTYGFERMGAQTLVMVADPDYLAVRVYRAVGFQDTETQLQAERPPQQPDA